MLLPKSSLNTNLPIPLIEISSPGSINFDELFSSIKLTLTDPLLITELAFDQDNFVISEIKLSNLNEVTNPEISV